MPSTPSSNVNGASVSNATLGQEPADALYEYPWDKRYGKAVSQERLGHIQRCFSEIYVDLCEEVTIVNTQVREKEVELRSLNDHIRNCELKRDNANTTLRSMAQMQADHYNLHIPGGIPDRYTAQTAQIRENTLSIRNDLDKRLREANTRRLQVLRDGNILQLRYVDLEKKRNWLHCLTNVTSEFPAGIPIVRYDDTSSEARF